MIAGFLTLVIAIPLVFSGGLAGPSVVVIAEPGSIPDEMPLVIITDLDHSSKVQPGGDAWKAILKRGALLHKDGKFSMRWDGQDEMQSGHAEAGRGMELSELQFFSNRLFAFDDRSGMVFEVLDYKSNSPKQPRVVPRHILMEGDGDTDKGFKIEWATVKDGKMIVGSFGKEFTDKDTKVVRNYNNLWVKVIDKELRVTHVDWRKAYTDMRAALGFSSPGYLLHETGIWNPYSRKWIFLPRRASKLEYDDTKDESRGTNLLIEATENFDSFNYVTVGTIIDPRRGFSSAKLVPGSHGRVIVALKSLESSGDAAAGEPAMQTSFITVFDTDGNVLMEEQEIDGDCKYEGLEFI